jgi:hypothetical protein
VEQSSGAGACRNARSSLLSLAEPMRCLGSWTPGQTDRQTDRRDRHGLRARRVSAAWPLQLDGTHGNSTTDSRVGELLSTARACCPVL